MANTLKDAKEKCFSEYMKIYKILNDKLNLITEKSDGQLLIRSVKEFQGMLEKINNSEKVSIISSKFKFIQEKEEEILRSSQVTF